MKQISTKSPFNLKRWFINLFWTKWKVTKTTFPYHDGYGVYRINRLTMELKLLDTGINEKICEDLAEEMNRTGTSLIWRKPKREEVFHD